MGDAFDTFLAGLGLDYWASGDWLFPLDEFMARMTGGEAVALLDLREPEETALLALPFALHIPLRQLPERLDEIPRDRPVAAFCSGDVRATVAYAYLRVRGYANVRVLIGGYEGLAGKLDLATVKAMAEAGA